RDAIQSLIEIDGFCCQGFLALAQYHGTGRRGLTVDMHFNGELLICGDGWRSHDRFYPDIAALTRFEWLCEHMNVFAIQPRQGARDVAGVFIAIGDQDRSLEMVRSKA